MAEKVTREQLELRADIRSMFGHAPTIVDRTFTLPKALYTGTVALYLGFIALMALGFSGREMALPFVVFAFVIVAGFGIPTIWTRLAPQTPYRAVSWGAFQAAGIDTHTGRVSARDATVQVLILPVLIFLWGVVVVTIAATV